MLLLDSRRHKDSEVRQCVAYPQLMQMQHPIRNNLSGMKVCPLNLLLVHALWYCQVLFCRLTSYQRELYREFLESEEVKLVLSRTKRAFKAIGILRKLCNHPDLVCRFGESIVNRCDES